MIKKSQKRYIFQEAEFKIAQTLAENWYTQFNTGEFAKSIGIGRATVYRAIRTLLDKGMATKNKNLFTINKKSSLVYNFKKFVDSYKLEHLDEKTKNIILDIYNSISEEAKDNLKAFLLVGSAARNEHEEESDIDFMVILKKKQDIIKDRIVKYEKINIIIKTSAEFEREYLESDDFILSSLINNLILFDDGFFMRFLMNDLPSLSERIINIRQEQLEKLKKRLYEMLKIDDRKRLVDQYKKYLILLGRIKLLKKGIIPGTKKQIFIALRNIDSKIGKSYNSSNEKNIKEKVLKVE